MSNSSSFIKFLFSKQFVIQVVLVMIFSLGLIYAVLKLLDNYTMHGSEITIPDLTGIPKTELAELLKEKELKFMVIDSTFVLDGPKGIVLAQNPKGMSKVKKDRTIYVTISSKTPPSVKLPILTDKSMRQAKSMIENSGLKLGELIFIPDLCLNCVLGQRVNGIELLRDTVVPKGTKIDLVLGGGLSDQKVMVPWLINLTRAEAIKVLKSSFLNLGAELFDGTVFDDEDSTNSKIFAQKPGYGAKSWVRMGSSIDVEYTMLDTKIDSIRPKLDSSLFPSFDKDTL